MPQNGYGLRVQDADAHETDSKEMPVRLLPSRTPLPRAPMKATSVSSTDHHEPKQHRLLPADPGGTPGRTPETANAAARENPRECRYPKGLLRSGGRI